MKTPEEMAEEYAAIRSVADESVVLGANPWTKAAFLAGYKAAQPQWISVKDRLPEDRQYVLGIVFGDVEIGYISRLTTDPSEFNWEAGDNWIDKGHSALTHWMPLPKPPEEKKS